MYLYGNDLGDPASNDEQGKCKWVLCGEQKRRSCAKPRQNKSNASLSLEQRKGETQKREPAAHLKMSNKMGRDGVSSKCQRKQEERHLSDAFNMHLLQIPSGFGTIFLGSWLNFVVRERNGYNLSQ